MKRWTLLFPILLFTIEVSAQRRLTLFDVKEISNQVGSVMNNYGQLIGDMTIPVQRGEETERAAQQNDDIAACFQQDNPFRVFYNDKAYVESDVELKSGKGNTLDMTAPEYLKDICLFVENGVKIRYGISDISSVKRGDFLFVRLRFWSRFSNLKTSREPGSEKAREAIFRIDSLGNHHWAAFIERITFEDPANNDIDDADKNITITIDSSINARPVSREDVITALKKDSVDHARQVEEKMNMALDYERKGDSLYVKEENEDAQLMYTSVKTLMPFLPGLNDRIVRNNQAIRANAVPVLLGKAEEAERRHKYDQAIAYYEKILKKGHGADSVQAKIAAINAHVGVITVPLSLLQANRPEDAIQECERVLKGFNDPANADAELFYVEGKAYEILTGGTNKKKDDERILRFYDAAIRKFPAYSEALRARAAFYTRRGDLGRAAASYELLCINTDDADPSKPGYYETKARLENASGSQDDAYTDYTKAIHLARRDSFFYERARLSYDRKKNSAAETDLDTALSLNSQNAVCYFLRGLNEVQLDKLAKAGYDFYSAEQNGIDSTSINIVDTLAGRYFQGARTAQASGDFAAAGKQFDQVLLLRHCHAAAMHGKADIKYRKGISLEKHKAQKAAADSLGASLDWNNKALKCNSSMSDAYLDIGLAQRELHRKDTAILSFNKAIELNGGNDEAFEQRGNTFSTEFKNYGSAARDYAQSIELVAVRLSEARKSNHLPEIEALNSRMADLYVDYGRALHSDGNDTGAMRALKTALSVDKNNADAWYNKGLVDGLANSSRAIDDLTEALRLRNDFHFTYALGCVELDAGRYGDAIDNFAKTAQLDSANEMRQTYFYRGVAHFEYKMYTDAQVDFDLYKASGDHSDDARFLAIEGMNQLFLDHDKDALADFNASKALSANSPFALLGLGFYYAKQGDYKTALAVFIEAYQTGGIRKKDIQVAEDRFLKAANNDRDFRKGYSRMKKDYLQE